jgi:hypothetical protein
MTRTVLRLSAARPESHGTADGRRRTIVNVIGLVLVAAGLRFYHLDRAFELFIDEVTYTDIALSVAEGHGVRLHGEAFHLHPPGMFLVLAASMRGLSLDLADLATLTYEMRLVPAVFGSITPAVVALAVRRTTGRWTLALPAGLLLALEPFLIRFDSRVLLEAQAMAFAALGFLGLLVLMDRERAGTLRRWQAVAVGVVLFISLITKETYASVTVLPVLVLLVTGLVLSRGTVARVLATTVTCYLVYVAVLAATGELLTWFDSKTSGVQRLLGLSQVTGFNSSGHSAGLVDRILVNLANFGVTYSVIGLGVLSTAWLVLLLRGGGAVPGCDRGGAVLVVVWSLCAQVHLGYAVTLGTLEEQMFYLLVVTAVPALCTAAAALLDRSIPARPPLLGWLRHRGAVSLLSLGLVMALAVDAAVWWRIHTVRDDAYARFLAWAEDGLPPNSRVVVTDETAQFVLGGVRVVRLETGAETREFQAQYVVVVTELLEQGYSQVDADLTDIVRQGRLVFEAEGRTVGALQVYDVSRPLAGAPRPGSLSG